MSYAGYDSRNRDIINDRIYMHTNYTTETGNKISVSYACTYCDRVFNTKEELRSHIKSDHNTIRPILELNGRIAGQENYVTSIENVTLWMYGFTHPIRVNNHLIKTNEQEEVPLTDIVLDSFNKDNKCNITIGNYRINIFKFFSQKIDNEKLTAVITDWEERVSAGKEIFFITPDNLNFSERRYLEGFYSYYIACQASGIDKEHRYNEAYSILKSFSPITPKALCVLKTVCFKLNWIEKLKKLCTDDDDYKLICNFYDKKDIPFISLSDFSDKIYVENEIGDYIQAVKYLITKNDVKLQEYFDYYSNTPDELDMNSQDRILLLSARYNNENKNYMQAKKLYEKLKTPYFKQEATNYINSKRY